MIEVKNISKTYGKNHVLKGLSYEFNKGQVYGLVGPNGCGKTTLIRCICGFTQPDSGYVVVNGCLIGGKTAIRRLRRDNLQAEYETAADFSPATGVIIEEPGFLNHLSGMDNLKLLMAVGGRRMAEQAEQAMRAVGLDPKEKKPVGQYSLGMRQRLGFAQAVMENPDVLLLDEPFNAMDAKSMEEVHGLVAKLRQAGKTIIIASHSAEDIHRACDTVLQMDNGVIVQ